MSAWPHAGRPVQVPVSLVLAPLQIAVLVQLAFEAVGPPVHLDQTCGLCRFSRGFLRSIVDWSMDRSPTVHVVHNPIGVDCGLVDWTDCEPAMPHQGLSP